MAVAPIQNSIAASSRPVQGGRAPLARAVAGPARLHQDATRFKAREACTNGALPADPGKFASPEDFKAYVGLLVAAGQQAKGRMAGPAAALSAAEASVAQRENELGVSLNLARAGFVAAQNEALRADALMGQQVEDARAAVETARNPGRARAGKLGKELAQLRERMASAQCALATNRQALDGGSLQGKARAAAYAAIATHSHAIRAYQTAIASKSAELATEEGRVYPDSHPSVVEACSRLAELEQQRQQARAAAEVKLMQLSDRCQRAQEAFNDALAPAQQELADAQAACAPAREALDRVRERMQAAEANVSKTQRTLWWARGFQVERYLAEQAAALG
jgi:chromosome segregation ATPase